MQFAMPSITPAVKLLLILTVGVFLFQEVVLGFRPGLIPDFIDWLAISPNRWKAWFPFVPVWQLVTYGFLHADIGHILGNALFLYFLGTMLEGVIGTRRFWIFYLVSVVLAGFFQLMVGMFTTPGPILGASGGVLAIVCGMATLRPQTRIIFILFPITLKTLAIFYVAFDVLNVIGQLQGQSTNVASVAHLTGAAIGFFAVRRGWIWRDPIAAVERVREEHAERVEQSDRERLDALLEKINREGISALSSGEKAFLKRMSKR